MSKDHLREHFAAGEKTDLPGHCKFCGHEVRTEDFSMPNPEGKGTLWDHLLEKDTIYFCSIKCLKKAEGIFDGLDTP